MPAELTMGAGVGGGVTHAAHSKYGAPVRAESCAR